MPSTSTLCNRCKVGRHESHLEKSFKGGVIIQRTKTKTKLILVEGLPSSGKSTSAKLVSEILNERDVNNEFFCEGNLNHPADYDGVALFDDIKFNELVEVFKTYKEEIYSITLKKDFNTFVEYKKGILEKKIKFPEKLLHEFYKNDIYELPLETHMELIKDKWIAFSKKAKEEEKIYVFDCPFIQNPVTVTMIRNNTDKATIIKYIRDLEDIVKDLNPVLLYIDQKDIEYSFKKSIAERPNEWLEFFINYYTKQGYGKDHNYEGLNGVIEILNHRKKVEKDIIQLLDMDSYIIENSEFNLKKLKSNIEDIVKKYI